MNAAHLSIFCRARERDYILMVEYVGSMCVVQYHDGLVHNALKHVLCFVMIEVRKDRMLKIRYYGAKFLGTHIILYNGGRFALILLLLFCVPLKRSSVDLYS